MGNKASSLGVREEDVVADCAAAINEFGAQYVRAVALASLRQHNAAVAAGAGHSADDARRPFAVKGACASLLCTASLDAALSGTREETLLTTCAAEDEEAPPHLSAWPFRLSCPPPPCESLATGWLYKLGEVNVAWKRRWAVVGGRGEGYAALYYERAPVAPTATVGGLASQASGGGVLSTSHSSGGGGGGAGLDGLAFAEGRGPRPKGSITLGGYRVRHADETGGKGAAAPPPGAPTVGLCLEPVDALGPLPPMRTWQLRFEGVLPASRTPGGGLFSTVTGGGVDGEQEGGGDDTEAYSKRSAMRDALRFAALHALPPAFLPPSPGGGVDDVHASAFLCAFLLSRWSLGLAGHVSVHRPEREMLALLAAHAAHAHSLATVSNTLARGCLDELTADQAAVASALWTRVQDAGTPAAATPTATVGTQGVPPASDTGGALPSGGGDSARRAELSALLSRTAAACADSAWPILLARAELLREVLPSILTRHERRASEGRVASTRALRASCEGELRRAAAAALKPALPTLLVVLGPMAASAARASVAGVCERLSACVERGLRHGELRALYAECQVSTGEGSALGGALAAIRAVTRPPQGAGAVYGAGGSGSEDGSEVLPATPLVDLLSALGPVTLWEVETATECVLRAVSCACVYTYVRALETASRRQEATEPRAALADAVSALTADADTAVRVVLTRVALAASARRLQAVLTRISLAASARRLQAVLTGDEPLRAAAAGAGTGAAMPPCAARPLVSFRVFDTRDMPSGSGGGATPDPLCGAGAASTDGLPAGVPPLFKLLPTRAARAAVATACAPALAAAPSHSREGGVTAEKDSAAASAALDATLTTLFWDAECELVGLLEQEAAGQVLAAVDASGLVPLTRHPPAGAEDG